LADLGRDAILIGEVVLVATTRWPEETQTAKDVIQEAVGSVKDVRVE